MSVTGGEWVKEGHEYANLQTVIVLRNDSEADLDGWIAEFYGPDREANAALFMRSRELEERAMGMEAALREMESKIKALIPAREEYRHLDPDSRREQQQWNAGAEACLQVVRAVLKSQP